MAIKSIKNIAWFTWSTLYQHNELPNRRTVVSSEPASALHGDGSKPWYLANPKIAGKWMFIPLKMYLYCRY